MNQKKKDQVLGGPFLIMPNIKVKAKRIWGNVNNSRRKSSTKKVE